MTNDKKIFLTVKLYGSDGRYITDMNEVELTYKELELLKICLENNKADFEHEGCLPSHKVMLDRIEALLKKLETIQ